MPTWPEEARDFVVGVVAAGGNVTRSGDRAAPVRVQQRLDETDEAFTAFVRPGTSDLAVWNQVVRERDYAAVVRVLEQAACSEVETILDLGANIGLTAAYLGAIYPRARIVAVEPDAANFGLLKRNTEPLGSRVQALQAAFWPREEPLSWASEPFRDGRDWARAVERSRNRGNPIDVITPTAALARLGVQRADLAKVDIEGAEAEFFATEAGTEALLSLADVFAIELHLESVDPLKVAIAFDRGGFLTLPAGDFLIAIRRDRIRVPS
jgi:FkbM family methyltransferase